MPTAGIRPLPLKPIKRLRTSLKKSKKTSADIAVSIKACNPSVRFATFSGKMLSGPPWTRQLNHLGPSWGHRVSFAAPQSSLERDLDLFWGSLRPSWALFCFLVVPLMASGGLPGQLWILLEPLGAHPGALVDHGPRDAHNFIVFLVDFWIRCDWCFPSTVLRMLGEGGWEWTGPRFAFGIH